MKCATCGMEYGMTHNCAGARPAIVLPAIVAQETAPPPRGFSPIHYIREAFRIAVWNGDAIQRASRDPNALRYGIAIWIVANSIPVLASAGRPSAAGQMLVGLILLLTLRMLLSLAQIEVCFQLAKLFMGGEGRFVQILRPLLLGSIVLILVAIPYVGIFAAAIAWICVFAMVFQVVADVESFSAYILSIVVGIAFRELESALAAAFR
jgi:hypothetical protein